MNEKDALTKDDYTFSVLLDLAWDCIVAILCSVIDMILFINL